MPVLANADFSIGEFLLWMLWIFLFVICFWLLITIFSDVFRRHDIHGGVKTLWIIFVIVFPFLGIFIYLITQSKGMAERNIAQAQAAAGAAASNGRDQLRGRAHEARPAQGERIDHRRRVPEDEGQGHRLTLRLHRPSRGITPGGPGAAPRPDLRPAVREAWNPLSPAPCS